MIAKYFGPVPRRALAVQIQRRPAGLLGAAIKSTQWHFDSWDRQVPSKQKRLKQLLAAAPGDDIRPYIELEPDGPAPRKITSRLVDAAGWDDQGRKELICALQSPLVPTGKDTEVDGKPNDFAVTAYITLGAITGPYYATYDRHAALPSAFPYKNRPFTIQFQAWWDQFLNTRGEPKKDLVVIAKAVLANRPWINRAQDWIEACRDYKIAHTSGAFISFKDSAVRTETYFASSYQPLIKVKLDCAKDPHVLFRTRKTII